jgi:hypothetical protein
MIQASLRQLETVEHPVDDHAGDRDIKPERQCPAGDAFVLDKVSL